MPVYSLITKQHPPIYNNFPTLAISVGRDGVGPGASKITTPTAPIKNSAFIIHNSAFPPCYTPPPNLL